MKFIKLFKEQTAFDEAKSTLNRPNVSLVKENNNVYLLKKKNANGYSYVDLGLSVKWATMNVGATSETDYGNYFMWGSTTSNTASECTWSNAPFNNGLDSYNEEYFNAHKSEWLDDNNNLKPKYDAASHIMGGDWRIPTNAEFQELFKYTTKEWTQVNGVNGYKFTSKKEGFQNNSIFIPAAGYRSDGSVGNVGSSGGVWSSSLYTSDHNYAWYLGFNSSNCTMGNSNRCYGRSVRGVRKSFVIPTNPIH